jgi:hypothetical protein
MKMYGKHRFPGKLFIVEEIDDVGKEHADSAVSEVVESEGFVTRFSECSRLYASA